MELLLLGCYKAEGCGLPCLSALIFVESSVPQFELLWDDCMQSAPLEVLLTYARAVCVIELRNRPG